MGINETLASFFKNLSNHGPSKAGGNNNKAAKAHGATTNNGRRVSKSKPPSVTYAVSATGKEANQAAAAPHAVAMQKPTKKKAKKLHKARLQLEKALMKNFVGVACNSTNALGAFLYGAAQTPPATAAAADGNDKRKKHKKGKTHKAYRTMCVDTAFIPSQTAGKYVVKVNSNNADGTVSAPFNSTASDAAAAASGGNNEHPVDVDDSGGKGQQEHHHSHHRRHLIGWLQMIHVDKRIIRQKAALLKDLFAHIEKTLGHLFAADNSSRGGAGNHATADGKKMPLMIVCGFVKNGHLVDARAYERTGHKSFSKVSLQLVDDRSPATAHHRRRITSSTGDAVTEAAGSSDEGAGSHAGAGAAADIARLPSLEELARGVVDLDVGLPLADDDLELVAAAAAAASTSPAALDELDELGDEELLPFEPLHGGPDRGDAIAIDDDARAAGDCSDDDGALLLEAEDQHVQKQRKAHYYHRNVCGLAAEKVACAARATADADDTDDAGDCNDGANNDVAGSSNNRCLADITNREASAINRDASAAQWAGHGAEKLQQQKQQTKHKKKKKTQQQQQQQRRPRRGQEVTMAAREWFDGVCAAGQVPGNVRRGAMALFRRTFPLQRDGNPTAMLMDGFEVPASSGGSNSRSSSKVALGTVARDPLLTCSQHQIACLRLAYKFIDDLYPQLTAFAEVADPPPVGHNPKNWWRLAETAIMADMNWQLHDFFRQAEAPGVGGEWWE